MVVEKLPEVNPPFGRVRCIEGFWLSRSWKRGGDGTEEKTAMWGPSRGFLERGVNIGQRGAPWGGPSPQAPCWRDLGWGRVPWPPGRGVAPLRPSFGLPEAFVALFFYIFFLEFFG